LIQQGGQWIVSLVAACLLCYCRIPQISHDPVPGVIQKSLMDGCRGVAAKFSQRVGFCNKPPQLRGGRNPQRVAQHRHPEVDPLASRQDRFVGVRAQVALQDGQQIVVTNSTLGQLIAVAIFGKINMAAEDFGSVGNRFMKPKVFQRVQRVVVNENGDRPLRRQEVRRMLDRVM
jgi:hypothetical protein